MNNRYLAFLLFLGMFFPSFLSLDLHAKSVEVIVKAIECDDVSEMHIFSFDGLGFVKEQSATKNKEGDFVFKVKTNQRLFRYVGIEVGKFKSVVLGDDEQVVMKGTCKSFNRATVSEGLNYNYNELMNKIRSFSSKEKSIGTRFAKSLKDESKKKELILEFAALDQRKKDLIEEAKSKSEWLGEVAGLYTYYSYQNSKTDLPNELMYYVNNYFAQTDLKSKAFEGMPLLFDVFNKYSSTLCKVRGLKADKLEEFLNLNLNKLPLKSDSRKMALGGIVSALKGVNNPLFVPFAKRYIDQFCKDSEGCMNLKKQIKNAESFVLGAEAPDFTLMNMEGEPVSLSDFKGKVVLIDFWASWCGPCRRENPHVAKLYSKYKADGFEILGVSLDKTKDRWIDAVAKDKLTWPQVSDLKGWQNEVAQMYSVKSIPDTVLLDKEGKILARKLRGPELDQKLASIFGH